MTQLTENLTVWKLWYFKALTSYRGERFQVPTRLTTVTRQTGEYKVDLTCHPKFPFAFGELASGRFPHCIWDVLISYWKCLSRMYYLVRNHHPTIGYMLCCRVRIMVLKRHFQQYFSCIPWRSVLLVEETESTWRKPQTCCKSLTAFII